MVACLAVIAFYLKYGKAYLDSNLAPFYHNLIVLTLAMATVFTVGCVLHMIFIGDRSARELRSELRKKNEAAAVFIAYAQKRICELHPEVLRHVSHIRPRSMENISQARRIIHALNQRTEEIRALLASNDKIDIIDAHELLGQPLIIVENCVNSLIGAEPLPPIEADQVISTVEQMFEEIEADLKRIAIRRRAA